MRISITLLLVLLSFGVFIPLHAQKAVPPPPKAETLYFADTARYLEKVTELGILLGGLHYKGDLNDNKFPSADEVSPAGGIFVRRHLCPNIALRANLLTGKLSGQDKAYPDRNHRFSTDVHELSIQAEWDIFGKQRYRHVDTTVYTLERYTQNAMVNKFRRTLLPYLFVGGGAMMTNAKATFNEGYGEQTNQLVSIQEDERNGKGLKTNFGILFGGGLNFDLGRKWLLGAELGTRTAYTDYFDGIKKAGGPKYNDWYWLGALNLSYRFGVRDHDGDGTPDKTDKCPDTPGMGRTGGCPDADNDGLADLDDACPRVAGIPALAGCPVKDADSDGIQDIDDLCPTVAGLVLFKGCPDTDADGIEDKLDSCKTVAGLVQFNGCPDTDGDGIEDKLDACPKEKGPAEYYYGCPVRDTDGDGVEDKLDACLLAAGKAEFKGCPDTDGDGVEDRLDVCPATVGKPENKGCPVVEKKDLERLKFAVKAVKFETGKAVLKKESYKILTEIAGIMNKYPDYLLRIEGHTDNVGKDAANQKLSELRAKACLDFVAGKNINSARIQSLGFGKTKPVADNKTAAGRANNRRVEFTLYLPEKR